jgi:ribonuclease P/MRP protein subunit RPP1
LEKVFIDLWIRRINDKTINYLVKLGYRAIAVEELSSRVRRFNGLIAVNKVVVEAENRKELRRKLQGIKTRAVIVSVKPFGIEAARMAAHDGRVDTIIIDEDTLYYIDKQQINMMKHYVKPLELSLNNYLRIDDRLKAMIYRRVNLYLRRKMPLLVSSGASDWYELLVPRSAVTMLKILFGISVRNGLLFMSNYPLEILVANGVRV